jgi:hypothetical protein
LFFHDSILSNNGASSKSGAIHFDQKNPLKANTLKEFVRLVVRDVLTAVGAGVNGFGTPYRIEFTGSIPAPKGLPK